ncbi:hypothetical protein ACFE04_013659 [Oxalis oulophora]
MRFRRTESILSAQGSVLVPPPHCPSLRINFVIRMSEPLIGVRIRRSLRVTVPDLRAQLPFPRGTIEKDARLFTRFQRKGLDSSLDSPRGGVGDRREDLFRGSSRQDLGSGDKGKVNRIRYYDRAK